MHVDHSFCPIKSLKASFERDKYSSFDSGLRLLSFAKKVLNYSFRKTKKIFFKTRANSGGQSLFCQIFRITEGRQQCFLVFISFPTKLWNFSEVISMLLSSIAFSSFPELLSGPFRYLMKYLIMLDLKFLPIDFFLSPSELVW